MIESGVLPQSFAQELLWHIHRAAPDSSAYNVPRTRLLRGSLDVEALRRALETVAERHEILRTTYGFASGQAIQIVHPPQPLALTVQDLRALPPEARRTEAERLAREAALQPFDLAVDVPLRGALFRTDDDEHVLQIDSHHIASDGASRDIFLRELALCYVAFCAGRTPELAPLPLQFGDFALWERRYLAGDRLERLLRYWRAELGDVDTVLGLPPDVAQSAATSRNATTRSISIEPEQLAAIKALAGRSDATLYMTVLAAYATVLHGYVPGGGDVLVGAPISGRGRPGLDHLIGCFVNTTVQRVRFDGDPSFAELLRRVRESCLGAYDHRELPLEKLLLELHGDRAAGEASLLQAVFTMLDPGEGNANRLGDVAVQPLRSGIDTTKFALTLFMAERPAGLSLSLRVRADLWQAATVDRFLGRLSRVLDAATRGAHVLVSSLPPLDDEERAQLATYNATSAIAATDLHTATDLRAAADIDAAAARTFVEFFDDARARFPGRTALLYGDLALSYDELGGRADTLAHQLRARGAAPNRCIGILLDRSVQAIVSLLAVAKSGAAYAFLSPDLPPARLAQHIAESAAQLVITICAYEPLLPADARAIVIDADGLSRPAQPSGVPPPAATDAAMPRADAAMLGADADGMQRSREPHRRRHPHAAGEELAYVAFTSGSSGVPKAVAVTHANVMHYVRAISRVFAQIARQTSDDGLAALQGLHFGMAGTLAADLGNTALFPALCGGGTLHLLPADVTNDSGRFAAYLSRHELDILKITPSHLRALLPEDPAAGVALPSRWLVLGGEAFDFGLALRVLAARRCRVLNHYGPTETTVGATTFEVTAASLALARAAGARTVPIGRPLAGVQAHVLDGRARLLPPDMPGELYVSGGGVARGYLGRPQFTAERFMMLEGIGRAYRTGDRVRRLPDGALEYLGRTDAQLKIRGYRVEPGDVAAALRAFSDIADAKVVPFGDVDVELAAYVITAPGTEPDRDGAFAADIRRRLREALPAHMIPRAVMVVDAFPLTPNGKLDRRALPAPQIDTHGPAVPLSPTTETERVLLAIWANAFKRDPDALGTNDDFLTLGGHSLLAIRVLGAVSRKLGVRLGLGALFEHRTVAGLATYIDARRDATRPDPCDAGEPARIPRAAFRRQPGASGTLGGDAAR